MELDSWLTKLKQAGSHREVFAILDQFRTLEWTDEERSKVSKLYMRMLENLGTPTSDTGTAQAALQVKGASGQAATAGSSGAKAAPDTNGTNRKNRSAETHGTQGANGANASSLSTGNAKSTESIDTAETAEEDGPVWYEKM